MIRGSCFFECENKVRTGTKRQFWHACCPVLNVQIKQKRDIWDVGMCLVLLQRKIVSFWQVTKYCLIGNRVMQSNLQWRFTTNSFLEKWIEITCWLSAPSPTHTTHLRHVSFSLEYVNITYLSCKLGTADVYSNSILHWSSSWFAWFNSLVGSAWSPNGKITMEVLRRLRILTPRSQTLHYFFFSGWSYVYLVR